MRKNQTVVADAMERGSHRTSDSDAAAVADALLCLQLHASSRPAASRPSSAEAPAGKTTGISIAPSDAPAVSATPSADTDAVHVAVSAEAEVSPSFAALAHEIKQQAARAISVSISEKEERKRKAVPRANSAQKIESLYDNIDCIKRCTYLVARTASFIESIKADANDPNKMLSHLSLAEKCLCFASKSADERLADMSKAANHTKAKKHAEQSHRKLSRKEMLEQKDRDLQLLVLGMIELMYLLMMDERDRIVEATPFHQFLGPLNIS